METKVFLNGITVEELAEALIPLLQTKRVEQEDLSNDFITREEACELLYIKKTALWNHTKNGKLKSYSIGNRVLYKRSEVLEAVKPLKS